MSARLDRWLPEYQEATRHETLLERSPEEAWQAFWELDLRRSPIISLLLLLRSIPAMLSEGRAKPKRLTFRTLIEAGFQPLEIAEGEEAVVGLVGKFWTPTGSLRPVSREEFASFREPGFAQAVWNFRLESVPAGTRLTTETRVFCTDARSLRKFRIYWLFVRPFSSLIRREMLRLLRAS